MPFGSPFNIQVGGFNFGPTELLFALTVAAWLGHKLIARDLPLPQHPSPMMGEGNALCHRATRGRRANARGTGCGVRVNTMPLIVWPLAAFLFALAMTLTVTHSLPDSLKEIVKWSEVLLVVIFVSSLLDRRYIPFLLALLFVSAAIESAIGLYQTVQRIGPKPFLVPLGGQLVMRSYGTFEQPNPFAAYLNFSLPIIASILLGFIFERGKAGEMRGNEGNKGSSSLAPLVSFISPNFLFVIALLTLPLIVAAFFFSLSRGAWLGFALAFVVMTALRSRRAFIFFSVLTLVLIGMLVLGSLNILPPAISERIADLPMFFGLNLFDPRAVVLTNENFGIVDRMAHWFAAWNMFNDFPWLGVGIGNYGVMYAQYGLREWPLSLGHAHNIYLNMLAETGLIGLAFYLLLVFSVLGRAACARAVARNCFRHSWCFCRNDRSQLF
ncbi:MAG: hypothetical protein C4294_17655 [Nitrospiraceae bacterium]